METQSHATVTTIVLQNKRKNTSSNSQLISSKLSEEENQLLKNLPLQLNELAKSFCSNISLLNSELKNLNEQNEKKLLTLSLASRAFTEAYLYSKSHLVEPVPQNFIKENLNKIKIPSLKVKSLDLVEKNISDDDTKNTVNTASEKPELNNKKNNEVFTFDKITSEVKTKKIYFNIIRTKEIEPPVLTEKQIAMNELKVKLNQNVIFLLCRHSNNRIRSLTKIDSNYINDDIQDMLKTSKDDSFYDKSLNELCNKTNCNLTLKEFEQFNSNSNFNSFINKSFKEILREYFYSKSFNKELYELSKHNEQGFMRSLVKVFESLLQ